VRTRLWSSSEPSWGEGLSSADRVRWAMRAIGVCLIVAGVVLFSLHPHVSYVGYATRSGARTTRSSTCISPWNEFSGHYYPAEGVRNVFQSADLRLASAACQAAISGRAHVGWLLLILGVVVLLATLLPWSRNRLTAVPSTGLVEYDLRRWPAGAVADLLAALAQERITYSWDAGAATLKVDPLCEDRVNLLVMR